MELKTGYKQTEVGVIPSDWDVKKLGELGKFSKGSGVRKGESLSGDIPCVRYGELYTRHSDYIKQFYSFISKEVSETAKKLKTGDILFAGSGETKEEIGKSVAFIDEFDAYAGGDIVILTPTNAEPLYLGYLLNAPIIQKQKASRGQGDAVVHISASQLAIISIPLPANKAEQTAIATALSDTDQYITHLEKLIAKKRNIKQGAMQELLKPKEGWVVKELGEVGKFSKGQGIKKDDAQSGEIPCVRYGELYTRHNDYVKGFHSFISREISLTAKRLKIGDILFAGSGETKEEIGKCAAFINDFEAFAGGDIVILSPVNQSSLFLGFLLNTPSVQKQKASRGQGDAVVHISSSQLEKIEVALPSLETQNQIASILSDMDSEITTLETKLSKAQSIKLGMMQQLLTGIIRLV